MAKIKVIYFYRYENEQAPDESPPPRHVIEKLRKRPVMRSSFIERHGIGKMLDGKTWHNRKASSRNISVFGLWMRTDGIITGTVNRFQNVSKKIQLRMDSELRKL